MRETLSFLPFKEPSVFHNCSYFMPTRNQQQLVSTKSQISSVFTDNLVALWRHERLFVTEHREPKKTNQKEEDTHCSYIDLNLIIQEWKGYKKNVSLQTFAKIHTLQCIFNGWHGCYIAGNYVFLRLCIYLFLSDYMNYFCSMY